MLLGAITAEDGSTVLGSFESDGTSYIRAIINFKLISINQLIEFKAYPYVNLIVRHHTLDWKSLYFYCSEFQDYKSPWVVFGPLQVKVTLDCQVKILVN